MAFIDSDPYRKARKRMKEDNIDYGDVDHSLEKWRQKYFEAGPVVFAKEVLRIDPLTGDPLLVSEDQKKFLTDVAWTVNFAMAIAGRGAGKTFSLAIYITWRICTHKYWNLVSMGGARTQSLIIQRYITGWRKHNKVLQKVINRDVRGQKPEVSTIWNSHAYFSANSETSTRGEHCKEFLIDEEVAGEKDSEGRDAIEAGFFQISTSKNAKILRVSTCQNISGNFYKTWREADKMGYKRYTWSLAKHVSGETDPYLIYKDTNPNNWRSNVPWSSDEIIQQLRRQSSNEKWLVEILGGISVGSGLVYKPEDISVAECKRCENCNPYQDADPKVGFKGCTLLQRTFELSGMKPEEIPKTNKECLTFVKERVLGQDYGHGTGADATVILGKYRGYIFVLFADESVGKDDITKLNDIVRWAKEWNVEVARPDPAEHAYNNSLIAKNLAVQELDIAEDKLVYVHTSKKFIERHKLAIPKKYEDLMRNLRNIVFKNGKIRKGSDHSFDAFIYAISYYGEVAEEDSGIWSNPLLYQNINPFKKR